MNKKTTAESPIDVAKIVTNLFEMHCSGKKCNVSKLEKDIEKEALKLQAAVESGSTKEFLLQLKDIFHVDSDSQHQFLLTQFIREALEKPELELFNAQLAAISTRIIPKKIKEDIHKNLN